MFQITLRAARELSGYTEEEVANQLNITKNCYVKYENDPGKIPASIAHMIRYLFLISLDSIYIGE